MKKMTLLILLFALWGCIAGDFSEDRRRMHEVNTSADICEQNPDRCISGVTW